VVVEVLVEISLVEEVELVVLETGFVSAQTYPIISGGAGEATIHSGAPNPSTQASAGVAFNFFNNNISRWRFWWKQ
jgi:hypothetical protein